MDVKKKERRGKEDIRVGANRMSEIAIFGALLRT